MSAYRMIPVTIAAVLIVALSASLSAQDAPAPAGDASGTWKWTTEGRGGQSRETVLKLKQEGDKLTGTITGMGPDAIEIQDGSAKDGKLTFKVVRKQQNRETTTTYTAKLDGGSIKGKSETVTTAEFEAKKE